MRISLREQLLAAIFAGIISILSQVTIPLGLIPLTLQTFIIGLTVTILGTKTGTWAITIYLILGLIGVPVFAGGSAGFGVLFGPTGGFLIGFIFNGLVTGSILEATQKNYFWAVIANIVGAMVTLFFGTAWLKFGTGMEFLAALKTGFIPFILPGIIKAVACGVLGIFILRRLPQRYFASSK
ncbi:biotin transporter BioY [Enterococcus montenegrensis]|uniref:biotin transporter BioY n=1 Tax=Enterococcus TaxID=1350 RepID=UPI001E3B8707|nr:MULTISPECIES: biotin transporter BioY [Enterococcus]MCD1025531.1 biotin transporter BioY [Enterococcus sp. SMC-9]WHA09606.1 biotin transporter BioY [Enterococcus montenegrensis]